MARDNHSSPWQQRREIERLMENERLMEMGRQLARQQRPSSETHTTIHRRVVRMRDDQGNIVELIEEFGQSDRFER